MYVLEALLLVTQLILGIRTAVTDIRDGYIYNRDLVMSIIPGTVFNVVYYCFFVQDIFADYLINLIVVCIIQILLYYTNSYAGGDLKLGAVMAFLYPARMYVPYKGIIVTLFFYIGYAIFLGYVYLLIDSIIRAVTHRSKINRNYVVRYIREFFISYIRASVYIFAITMIASQVSKYIFIPSWCLWILCMFLSWETRRRRILKDIKFLFVIVILDMVLAVSTKTILFSLYPETYLFSAALFICQMLIGSALYDTVATKDIKEGMILSSASSVLLQGSRVKGLPGISSESLKDRLSPEQVESIHRWEKTKRGQERLTIMRKIPFAIFLLLGMVTYFIGWVLLYEI